MDQPHSDSETQPTSSVDTPAPQPLVEPAKKGGSRMLTVILVAIIVILAVVLTVQTLHLIPSGPSGSPGPVSIQSAGTVATAGQPIAFSLTNLAAGSTAHVRMGDGGDVVTSNNTFTYTYVTGGSYLVWLQVVGSDGSVSQDGASSLLKLTVLPDISVQLAQFVAVPTIYFNTTQNAKAPITTTGTPLYLYGSFTESNLLYSTSQSFYNTTAHIYSNTSEAVSIDHYVWDLGNGQTQTVAADPDTSEPVTNPIPVTYAQSGLYFAQLTLGTVETLSTTVHNQATNVTYTNSTEINAFSVTVGATIPVGSSFAIGGSQAVPSAGIITEIVNSGGGPYSFDPQIDYETTGFEVIVNTAATLLFYNGSSTTDWFPYVASEIPTVANGEITNTYTTYTFKVRSNLGFSNGDPVTAYDVWYSTIRAMLFQGGYPGTADWIITQYLIPRDAPPYFAPFTSLVNDTNKQAAYNAIMGAVTYDNATNAVTFHLATSTAPSLFFTAVSDPLGMGIMDASWLQSIGAGITFTPDGFLAYQQQGNEGSYSLSAQFHPVTSGPFEINTYVPSTSVVLVPNPNFPGLPMIPKQTNTIILDWVASPGVAYQLFASGEGDIVTILPPPYYKTIKDTMVSQGNAVIHGPFPSITEFFAPFNVDINTTLLSSLGSFSIPSDYFANPLVRQAFAYAFNYTGYVDNILGNKKYGFNFGSSYCGVIVQGLPYYVPPSNLTGCPSYDLAMAKQLLTQSGEGSTVVNFPIIIPTGDTTDFTAAIVWAQALHSIDANITMTPLYQDFSTIIGDQVPGSDPMPLFFLGWIADYPYPSDYTDAMLQVGGTYPAPNGWDPTYLSGLAAAHPSQAAMYNGQAANFTQLSNLITAADTATNPSTAAQLYQQAEQASVSLYMYTYTYQQTGFWIVKPYIHPYQNNWGFQENPTIGAGADSCFFWWVKG